MIIIIFILYLILLLFEQLSILFCSKQVTSSKIKKNHPVWEKAVKLANLFAEYEGLTAEDIQDCLLFATKSLENTMFMPLAVGNT
ncbi:hypothetical protein M1N67_02480 [Peptococcaceae bacterium]|nr:hypothetical protein [Peptococcaceae bacterium]